MPPKKGCRLGVRNTLSGQPPLPVIAWTARENVKQQLLEANCERVTDREEPVYTFRLRARIQVDPAHNQQHSALVHKASGARFLGR